MADQPDPQSESARLSWALNTVGEARHKLVIEFGLGEHEALEFIQHHAMRHRATMVRVATDIMAGDLLP